MPVKRPGPGHLPRGGHHAYVALRVPSVTGESPPPSRTSMGRTGLEPVDATGDSDRHLRKQGQGGGAGSGAESADSVHFGPDLQRVIDAWPRLPEAVRAGVLAMITATKGG